GPGETYGTRRPLVLAQAARLDCAAVRGDECVGDPESQTGAGCRLDMAAPAEKSFAQMRAVLRRQAGTLVADREREHAILLPSANADGRAGWRIFGRVRQDLAERLLD